MAFVLLLRVPGVLAEDVQSTPPTAPAIETTPPDTSLKRFPQNLGKNYLGLFNKKNVLPLVIGSAATATVSIFDDDLKDHIGKHEGESSTIGKVGSVIGGPAVVIPTVTGLLIGGHYSHNQKFRVFTYNLAQAEVINESILQGLKVAVGRTRPDGSDNRSFPSGHAATSFMIATVVHRSYGTKAGIIGYSAATFISFSRIRENKHWASDVAGGATLGYIVGSSVCRRNRLSVRVGKITLLPAFDPLQGRVGISLVGDSE